MKKILNPLNRKWEFETNEGWLADDFLQVLKMFCIDPEDVYIPSFLDMSDIEFRTTEKRKDQIEYAFRRYINKNWYQVGNSLTEIEGGDWYAIY